MPHLFRPPRSPASLHSPAPVTGTAAAPEGQQIPQSDPHSTEADVGGQG